MIQRRALLGGTAIAFSSLVVAASSPGPSEPAPAAVAEIRSKALAMVARRLVPLGLTAR